MSKIRYNADDLMMQLREKGVFDLTEVEFAILEPHGQLSVLKKSQHLPLTPKEYCLGSLTICSVLLFGPGDGSYKIT